MKKIVLLLSLIILFTGCSVKELDKSSINKVIKNAIEANTKLYNTDGDGYKYYLPTGMKIIDRNGYNTKINFNSNIYYLYIDVISYYHKTKPEYTNDNSLYFCKKLDYKDKLGYVKIDNTKKNNRYFLEIMYNYAKIEVYVDNINLTSAIRNSIYLLSSLQINDAVLETLVGENVLNYTEEQLENFESKREDGSFLEVIKEYDKWNKDKEENKDEDIIIPDNNE